MSLLLSAFAAINRHDQVEYQEFCMDMENQQPQLSGNPDQQRAVDLSIVICTFNRAQLLDRALQSMAAQTARDRMEVIVIDNMSTDMTPQFLRSWQSRKDLLLITDTEPQHGRYAMARNRGISHAHGSIIAFLDDDACAPPDWAAGILKIFAEKPDVHCLGGPVEPDWEKPPAPKWANRELLFSLGVGDYGSVAKFLTKRSYPIGANMAFRATVLREAGGFDARLGIVGNHSVYCDEVELVERLRGLGKRVYYSPDIKARHYVPIARASEDYVLKRRRIDGHSTAVWENLRGGRWLIARNLTIRTILLLVRDVPGYLITAICRSNRNFTYKCRLMKTANYIKTAVRILKPDRYEN